MMDVVASDIGAQEENVRSKETTALEKCRNFDVEKILCETLRGHIIVCHFKIHKQLDEARRNIVADILVSHYLQCTGYDSSLSNDVLLAMFDGLKSVFPNEKKELWLGDLDQTRGKSVGRGKFLTKLYNLRKSMLSCGLISGTKKEKPMPDEDGESGDMEWLKANKEPWSKCLKLWKKTSKKRIQDLQTGTISVQNYLETYPGLKDRCGYLLLEADFEQMYPDTTMKLYTEWPKLAAFLAQKTPAAAAEKIDNALTPEGKKLVTILSIAYLFPVTAIARKTAKTEHWKPSRAEIQDTLVLVVRSTTDIPEQLRIRREKYERYGWKLGPQAVVCGSLDAPEKSFVVINSVHYEVVSPLAALDIAFKSKFALDSAYPKESASLWLFLQIAVYGIETCHDKPQLKGRVVALASEYSSFIEHMFV